MSATFTLLAALLLAPTVTRSDMDRDFAAPPPAARPHTYWYWIEGHTTREGIDADLEAMARVGIGGAMIFNIGGHGPKGPVKVLSPEWRELMKHAIRKAGELGLEINLNNSPRSWSSSNGPWVTPERSMQVLAWSETRVRGGRKFEGKLARPPARKGFYRDIAVLAFPTPPPELEAPPRPTVVSSGEAFDGGRLFDERVAWPFILEQKAGSLLPKPEAGRKQFVELTYPQPLLARSLSLVPTSRRAIRSGKLFAADGDGAWREVVTIPNGRDSAPVSLVFPPVTARRWRIEFDGQREVSLAELYLGPRYRVADWSGRAKHDMFGADRPPFTPAELQAPPECRIKKESLVRLSDRMTPEGGLDWDVPPGDWTVIRFGHTLNGMEKSGWLECDKFDKAALEEHWNSFAQPLFDDPETGPHIQYVHVDSYEAGAQNWSAGVPEEFARRCGYDLLAYFPALTGRVVDDSVSSERFLWDFRQVCCGLMAENYFGHLRELCRSAGKQFTLEGYHLGQFHCATVSGKADVPMCEFWANPGPGQPYWFKSGASPAHVYGRPIVAAEAFTASRLGGGNFTTDPWALKVLGDGAFCGGVNRFVYHVYTMQPWVDRAPGMTLAAYGTHFERTNTWFEQMKGFNLYVSRCQHLLRQGRFVADVLYSYGENAPNEVHSHGFAVRGSPTAMPPGYDYDFCGPEVILNRTSVREGELVVEGGMRYRLLVLPDDREVTPAMLRKIRDLVRAGAIVLGPRPQRSPSLTGQPGADADVAALAEELWGSCDGQGVREQVCGKGRVVWGMTVKDVLASLGVVEDFAAVDAKAPVNYIHRRLSDGDLYFVANAGDRVQETECAFRVSGPAPELWDPVTGGIRALPEFRAEGGRTFVPLRFEPRQSYFVMFRSGSQKSEARSQSGGKNFPVSKPVQELSGSWKVTFDPRWGGPDQPVVLDTLEDWSQRPESGIKYYSGKATYRKAFDLPQLALDKLRLSKGEVASDKSQINNQQSQMYLDLGVVKNVAEVRLNGKDLGVVWCAPWRVDVTGLLKAAGNELEIDIVNLWVNRLIGDEQLPDDCEWSPSGHGGMQLKRLPQWLLDGTPRPSGRYAFCVWKHWFKDDPLLPAGLLGPVRVTSED